MRVRSYRWLAAFSILAALVLVPVACGGDDDDEGSEASSSGTTVTAALGSSDDGEYTISLDKESVPAGEVTFKIANEGELEHEFEIVKTDVAEGDLPVEAEKAEVEAEGGEEVDEVEDLASGAEQDLTVDLEAGKYLLICNLPGHYEQGMVTAFTVE
jgi:uncharacterized cupredoxin-like copper-binding protein